MLSPYSEAQLLGRFCNFLMKSPNFGTPYCAPLYILYNIYHIMVLTEHDEHEDEAVEEEINMTLI